MLIDYWDDLKSFPIPSLTSLMKEEMPPALMWDKIVVVGTAAQDAKDFFYTPYSRRLHAVQKTPGMPASCTYSSQSLCCAPAESPRLMTVGKPVEGLRIFLWCAVVGLLGCLMTHCCSNRGFRFSGKPAGSRFHHQPKHARQSHMKKRSSTP